MSEHIRTSWWATSLALSLAACSTTVAPSTDAGTDRAPTPDTAVDVPAPPMSPCPREQPADGSACSRGNLTCEYGADLRRECRDQASCDGTVWRIQRPDADGTARPWCRTMPSAACPATLEAASGQTCSAQGAVCTYAGLVCECTNCFSFPVSGCRGEARWQCDQRPPAPGCPAASPRFGEVCAQDGLSCEYGCNSPDGSVACRGGVWQRGDFRDCPISSRSVKRDIVYVSTTAADALAARVRGTRLATYEYTIPSMAGRRRLGFIIEDQPDSFAVDPERSQVDLYGYTSMLVATVQTQDREIRTLSQRIEALERRLTAGHRARHR